MRPATPQDEAFLFLLVAGDRGVQLAPCGLPGPLLEQLVKMQYRGQQISYTARYPNAGNYILLTHEGAPAGRLLLDCQPDRWRIVDIAVLPAHRGKGLGTQAIAHCQSRCRNLQARLELQVNAANPARRLYERLGFRAMEETETSAEMLWLP